MHDNELVLKGMILALVIGLAAALAALYVVVGNNHTTSRPPTSATAQQTLRPGQSLPTRPDSTPGMTGASTEMIYTRAQAEDALKRTGYSCVYNAWNGCDVQYRSN